MTTMFDYTIPDHIPEELIFPLDGESHPELKKNPFAVFANLHKEAPPIFFNPAAFQGAGGWSISDGAIIKEVLQNPELFSSKNNTGFSFLLGRELDLFSIQVSLAAPYPGTELYELARQNRWFARSDPSAVVQASGFQESALEYPGLSRAEIFEAVERFYHRYYLRPRPILRILKTMLEDRDVCVRRLREGFEFFRTMAQRRTEPRT